MSPGVRLDDFWNTRMKDALQQAMSFSATSRCMASSHASILQINCTPSLGYFEIAVRCPLPKWSESVRWGEASNVIRESPEESRSEAQFFVVPVTKCML